MSLATFWMEVIKEMLPADVPKLKHLRKVHLRLYTAKKKNLNMFETILKEILALF